MGGGIFDDADVISRYTRAQAIREGTLIDVTAAAREHGIKYPVAITVMAHRTCVALTPAAERAGNDLTGRLCDVLTMLVHGIRRNRDKSEFSFTVCCVVDEIEAEDVELRAVAGGGDNGEPVVTVMLDWED